MIRQTEPEGPRFWRQESKPCELHIHFCLSSLAFARSVGEEAEPNAKVWSSWRWHSTRETEVGVGLSKNWVWGGKNNRRGRSESLHGVHPQGFDHILNLVVGVQQETSRHQVAVYGLRSKRIGSIFQQSYRSRESEAVVYRLTNWMTPKDREFPLRSQKAYGLRARSISER